METMITLKDAGIIILWMLLVALMFYLIFLIKNLVPTIKNINKILIKTDEMVEIVNKDVKSAHEIIETLGGSVEKASQKAADSESFIKVLTVIFSAIIAVKELFKK